MANNALLTQTKVQVDNIIFDLIAGSLEYKYGYIPVDSKPTLGGTGISMNRQFKPEEAMSRVKFEIENTQDNQNNLDTLRQSDLHTIDLLDVNGNLVPFVEMHFQTDFVFKDGGNSTEIILEGPPAKGQ